MFLSPRQGERKKPRESSDPRRPPDLPPPCSLIGGGIFSLHSGSQTSIALIKRAETPCSRIPLLTSTEAAATNPPRNDVLHGATRTMKDGGESRFAPPVAAEEDEGLRIALFSWETL